MRKFMQSRTGLDEINAICAIAGTMLQVCANATNILMLSWAAIALWLFVLMRALTPAIHGAARSQGYATKQASANKAERMQQTARKIWSERKEKRHYRCKTCGTILSVPRGIGKVRVTCPKCHTTIERKA